MGSPGMDFIQSFIDIENNQLIESARQENSLIVTDRIPDVVHDEEFQKLYDEFIMNNNKNHYSADRNSDEGALKEKQAIVV